MNTKKIWIISLLLGIGVAGIAYLSVFSKGKVPTTTTVAVAQNNDEKKTDEEQAKKEEALKREFTNPLVDVSNGKRAISINVDPAQGVSGYIAPNSKVDVIAYGTKKDDKTKKEYRSAVLVLENVKVLSSGKSSDNKEEALHYETVTLEVTPKEGVMLSLAAKDKDGFYLMLRNTEDTDIGKVGLKQTREVIKEGD